jgi:hypothetical protein
MTKRVTSLRDLPESLPPPRDLWPQIEATLQTEPRGKSSNVRRLRPSGLQIAALAAVVSALAVGVWIGRSLLPTAGPANPSAVEGSRGPVTVATDLRQAAVPAGFVTDPRYLRQRAALIRAHEQQLARLPPETRAKVEASLAAIRKSMQEIEAALGRDPSNALLQELLVNSYQDEMRVLTTVQEAGAREI